MALFKLDKNKIKQLNLKRFAKERELQKLFEENLEALFQVRFVASEFQTGEVHAGRIDTIGLDYDNNPVIIEYKLDKNNTVLNQGLYYMDWLIDHRGDFEKVAKEKLGNEITIDWRNPRLFLIAQEYSKFDKHAVNRINYDISLYKYLLYEDDTLYIENIVYSDAPTVEESKNTNNEEKKLGKYERKETALEDFMKDKPEEIVEIYKTLDENIMAINDQIARRYNQYYIGYRTTRNFAEVYILKSAVQVFVLNKVGCKSDYKNKLKTVPESYQWVVNSKMNITSLDEIDYALGIIKESYEMTL